VTNPNTTPEALALSAYVPDREGVRELLTRYFAGVITDAAVDSLYDRFMEVRSNDGDDSSLRRSFEGRLHKEGFAWWEEFVAERTYMTPSDLVLLLAHMRSNTDPNLPQPKLYCPEWFVGTWEQVEPTPQTNRRCFWHLERDGTFQADSIGTYYRSENGVSLLIATDVARKTRWRVVRTSGERYVELTLLNEHYRGHWSLVRIDPAGDEIVGTHLGVDGNPRFRLVRTVAPSGVYR